MLGLPFSGKVFNKPFLGLGFIHLKQVPWIKNFVPLQMNLYAGWVYEKEFRPGTLSVGAQASPGALANDLVSYRAWKPQFGVELSARSIKSSLANSKKTGQ